MAIVNLTLTNSLATEGEFLRFASREKDEQVQEISQLRQATMEAQSMESITARAVALGLTEDVKQIKFEPALLASNDR